ncbi:ATP-binding protein [Bradyrhizobium sp. SSUT18]|uniref:ATP-binding protein n=1 Tax=Bradyrhizobium sp. SSUT18 TaxID=3040602 RepID=UPI00244BCB71|nr:ATP-binding protein [Bradyrhizobium sp. SSUT18]MDH2401852.1 ATP-binding protein [Bradyrhizobium sp. SSUT18]
MALFQRLAPQSITAQITGLVAVSVVLGVTLLGAILWFLYDPPARDDSPIYTAARITEITRLVRAAKDATEADAMLAAIQRGGLEIKRVPLAALVPIKVDALSSRLATHPLEAHRDIEILSELGDPVGPPSQIITRLDDGHGLRFNLAIKTWPMFVPPTALLLIIVVFSALLMSIYAVRWVVAPLAAVAAAATSFGHSPQANDALSPRGPREIIQVTNALNEMRTRIRTLLDDRTRMLAAISHDLRTPLTRLRLRAEQIQQDNLRTPMLRDITKVGRMLDDTLEYLRDDAKSEPQTRVDLPSFLQTICSDFSDMGHGVTYARPDRLSYACHPRALSRAVTNIVENAVKHAGTISVGLGMNHDRAIEIDVSDDGPGIPDTLHDKVFEPFFKVDDARSENNSGFGLGLSIALEIMKRHGGRIEMRPREPVGLQVLMVLPAETSLQTDESRGTCSDL